jgi:hypothetical protein
MAPALEIMLDGPLGAAAFNNEFGRPNLNGYFRAFELAEGDGLARAYDKPIMLAGGFGAMDRSMVAKRPLSPGDAVIVLGGPAMLIGLGGGAASSVASGESAEDLDFASVQRDNPEMERRAQEVIDRCVALGDDNPILSIHDVGAGGLSNAIPELLHDSGVGGVIDLDRVPTDDPSLSPMQLWCNESQERYVMGIAPDRVGEFAALCLRERCPFAVVGYATAEERLVVAKGAAPGAIPDDCAINLPMDVLFGKAPKMHRDTSTPPPPRWPELTTAALDLNEAGLRVLAHPHRRLEELPDHHRRPHRRRPHRARPDGRPVADAGGRLRDHAGRLRELRGPKRCRWASARRSRCSTPPPPRAWPWARRSPTCAPRRSKRWIASSFPRTGWPPPATRAKTRSCSTPCAPSAWNSRRSSTSASRWARTRCRCRRSGTPMAWRTSRCRRCRSSSPRSRRWMTCASNSRRCWRAKPIRKSG